MVITGSIFPIWTVLVGGLVLGGGFGFRSRQYGLLSDNLKALEMVNYKGDIVKANDYLNQDLLWASKGGGGGQFGVLTTVQLQAHPTEKVVHRFEMGWDVSDFVQVGEFVDF